MISVAIPGWVLFFAFVAIWTIGGRIVWVRFINPALERFIDRRVRQLEERED